MRRREFITLLGGAAAAWPVVTHAQQGAMMRVGVVTIQPRTAPPYAAFDQRLRELGYVEGQNLILDFLNPEQQPGGNAGAVQELIRRKVEVIVVVYENTLKAALATTTTVPLVMVAIDYDPLALGFIKSLAQPGGNVTGVYLQQIDLAKKRVELLTQALPNVHAATVFWDIASEEQWTATRSVAAVFGLQLADVELRDQPYDYDKALAQVPPLMNSRRKGGSGNRGRPVWCEGSGLNVASGGGIGGSRTGSYDR
jgi:putative ABC transport system substrate-binding protein